MPRVKQGLTERYPLKMQPAERALLEREQTTAEMAGLTVSLNEVIRHLVRRASMPLPRTEQEARAAVEQHFAVCQVCEPCARPRCLDSLYVQRNWRRMRQAARLPAAPEVATEKVKDQPRHRK